MNFDPQPFPLAAGAGGRPVRTPVWRVSISDQDVTREIAPWVIAVTYTDHVHGASDDVEIQVHDSDGRWRDTWLPKKGDQVELQLGYEGEAMLPCGRFEVDELEAAGPPDTLTIRGLAAGPTSSLRTRRSEAYEDQTLRGVAERVAGRHGLTLQGEITDLRLGRLTQDRENDLEFLTRVADSLGYAFSVRGDRLVFYLLESLERMEPAFSIGRIGGVRDYRILSNSRAIFRACTVKYHNPGSKKVLTHTETAEGIVSGDTHEIRQRVEGRAHAQQLARAALQRLNGRWKEGELTMQGDQRAVAGINVTLTGWGGLDGTFHIATSRHRITRSGGYETIITVRAGGAWSTESGV